MKNLNYIKLFESYKDDDISEEDVIFTIKKEDIEDFLLPISDNGFKLEIKELYLDEDFSEIARDHYAFGSVRSKFRKKMLNNQIRGGYIITITKEIENDDLLSFKYNKEDIVIFNLLMSEISQLSKRVDYIEWSPYGKINGEIQDNIWMRLFIVCPLQKNTMFKELLKGEYKEKLSDCIYNKIYMILQIFKNNFTNSFNSSLITCDCSSVDGKIFFLFKPVSKSILSNNIRKLNGLRRKFSVKTIEQFKKEYPDFENIWINDTSFVLEVEYDIKKIEIDCKLELKSRFISRQND